MNVERLAKLADFVEANVPPNRFNMSKWATGDLNECGTAGCLAGWACMIPEFQEAGLIMDQFFDVYCPFYKPLKLSHYTALEEFFGFRDYDNPEAGREATYYIFSPERYEEPSLANTIARIREVIK